MYNSSIGRVDVMRKVLGDGKLLLNEEFIRDVTLRPLHIREVFSSFSLICRSTPKNTRKEVSNMNISQNIVKSSFLNHSKLTTRKLVLAAIFVAMSIILTRVGSIMLFGGAVRLGFGRIPIVLSSILLGPLAGGLTGLVSDLIGFMLNPMGGAFHPGFTLSATLTGIIPGLVVAIASKNKFSLLNITIANVLVSLIVSLGLNTLWLTQLLGQAFFVLLPWRIVSSGILTVISIFIIFTLSKYFKHVKV